MQSNIRIRARLRHGTAPLAVAALMVAGPALAQTAPSTDANAAAADAPASPAPADRDIVVTGSRIARPNLTSNSPIAVVTGEKLQSLGDITVETYLNTLPGINPAGTTTSNNPPNNGQANIDLRGLGPNRNLVLIDGRRPMVSAADQTVDVNTIPAALIDRVEVITGGGGAAYGADAIAGVVNFILKKNFSGVDARISYANTLPAADALEWNGSLTVGHNFADDRGNIVVSGEYSKRSSLVKAQRAFAQLATSTTTSNPEGTLRSSTGNNPSQAAIDTVFGKYGAPAGTVSAGSILFNTDGTVFSRGVFNSPIDVVNFRYPIDANVNTRFFPDFYTFNFDPVNLLVLPLERKSVLGRASFDVTDSISVFAQGQYAKYSAATALAPTPVGPTIYSTTDTQSIHAHSTLVTPGSTVTGLIVPVTNPFVAGNPDLVQLLNSRTGDNTALVGAGATEPFLISTRTLSVGPRLSNYSNEVYQFLGGVKWEFAPSWSFNAYGSIGRTKITDADTGGVNVDKLNQLLAAPDGGRSLCTGGYNPIGRNGISPSCVDFIKASTTVQTVFDQQIAQGYFSGDAFNLPAGPLQVVAGAEYRHFKYNLDPGALAGPIVGPNTQTAAAGTNSFLDFFGEVEVPLLKDQGVFQDVSLNLGYRNSRSKFSDTLNNVVGKSTYSSSYKAELSWKVADPFRLRGTYQRSVRAPNFGELFSGGSNFPQFFDPCSAGTAYLSGRTGTTAAQAAALCTATGTARVGTFVAQPAGQLDTEVAGNTALRPEKADTFTGGFVFDPHWHGSFLSHFTASVDYYRIKVRDVITSVLDPNVLIANCYNYTGVNPSYSPTNANCLAVAAARSDGGGELNGQQLQNPADPNGFYPGINGGSVLTSGLDIRVNTGVKFTSHSAINFDLAVNHIFEYKVQPFSGGPSFDYAGTVSNFAASTLGASQPSWKGVLTTSLSFDPFTFTLRTRYINALRNRNDVLYRGEATTGTPDVWYFDLSGEYTIKQLTFRMGVENLFNRQPPLYAPNVQSGTDPSLFDVIGVRPFVQARLKF